ncbi:MAG: 2-isopropylmalate synthase [Armatimonadota bacterium]
MRHIRIFDTTLRDGEQSPGVALSLDQKLEIAHALARLNVDILEAGFPVSGPLEFEAVRRIARTIRGPIIATLSRCVPGDVEAAIAAMEGAHNPRIHVFISSSDIHLMHQMAKDREAVLLQAVAAVKRAKEAVEDVEFSPMDATRSDPRYLYQLLEAVIDAGATTVNIPDTVGYTVPQEFEQLIRGIFENVRNIHKAVLSVHCHNDLGLAVANSLAAIEAGAHQVECTVNGIGERAGNAALEEIVMACVVRSDRLPIETGIRTPLLYPTSQMLSEIVGFPVQPNKAIVGRNAFAHEAGIHQHGVLSNPLCYEIMTPESVGAPADRIVLGKHSGRHALAQRYAELGHPLAPAELETIYKKFIKLADRKKRIYDQDLLALLHARASVPQTERTGPTVPRWSGA